MTGVQNGTLRFRHFGITVSDMDRALAFWAEGLRLEVEARQERSGGYIDAIVGERDVQMLQVHLLDRDTELRIELLQYAAPRGRRLAGRPPDAGHAHVAVTCPDTRASVDRLVDAGGTLVGKVVEIDSGAHAGFIVAYVADPDGHVVELMQPPRSRDQVDAQEHP